MGNTKTNIISDADRTILLNIFKDPSIVAHIIATVGTYVHIYKDDGNGKWAFNIHRLSSKTDSIGIYTYGSSPQSVDILYISNGEAYRFHGIASIGAALTLLLDDDLRKELLIKNDVRRCLTYTGENNVRQLRSDR